MRIHPINPAESIIAPFFDPGLSPESDWTVSAPASTKGFRKAQSYTTSFRWDSAEPDVPAFMWEWRGELDLDGYNGLFLQAAAPSTARIELSVLVDDEYQLVARGQGCDRHEDYFGALPVTKIDGLKIEVIPKNTSPGAFSTYYIGVHNAIKLLDWIEYEETEVYPEDWPEFISPSETWTSENRRPSIGITFPAGKLDEIRAKIDGETYRGFADTLRSRARSCLAHQPERYIKHYARCGEGPYAYSARSRDRGEPFWFDMELCAFFGLLDDDEELIRMAARYAMSLVHCDFWCEGFVEHDFRGSAMNWRAFYQNYAVLALSNTLDWIGFAFTDHAKEVICHSLFFKGLTPLKHDFLRYEYIYHMNQAVVFSLGRIAAILAIDSRWPRMAAELQSARSDLDECARRIVHGDGGYGEGPGYYSAVLFFLFGSYNMLGIRDGIDPAELVPSGSLRCADYLGAFISTAGVGRRLPISDGGTGALATDWLAMAAAITGDPRWNGLLASILESDLTEQLTSISRHGLGTSVRTLIYGPEDLSNTAPIVPMFTIHEGIGHATSRRCTASGDIRIHLCGSSDDEGHSHGDKGAIIVEAFGRDVFIDRGTPFYGDPLTAIIKDTRWHNAISIIDNSGIEHTQINPCPGMIRPRGSGDEIRLGLEADIGVAWESPITAMSRRIESPDPFHITIIDRIAASRGVRPVFNLHSYNEFHIEGSTARVSIPEGDIHIVRHWDGELIGSGIDLTDGDHRDVYHLAMAADAGMNHELRTEITIVV